MIPPKQTLSPNPNGVVAEVIDGEAIIINLATGVYYSMDGIGAWMWELIEAGRSVEEIVAAIVASYEVSPERVETDVQQVAEELVGEQLVAVSEREPAGLADRELPSDGRLPYARPELKAYRDMGDLLALDPHLPGAREIPWKGQAETPP